MNNQYYSRKKSTNEKLIITIVICVTVSIIMLLAVAVMSLRNLDEDKTEEVSVETTESNSRENAEKEHENAVEVYENLDSQEFHDDSDGQEYQEESIPSATVTPNKTEEIIREDVGEREYISDVEAKVKHIRSIYNDIQSDLSGYVTAEYNGRKVYVDSETDKIVRIDYLPDEKSEYARFYYFDDEVFCFAFIFDGKKENRLYFHNGYMFRWIDEDGVIHDNESDNAEFIEWEEFALGEI